MTKLSELDHISKLEFMEKVKEHKLSYKSQIGLSKDMKFGIEIEFLGCDFDFFISNSREEVTTNYVGWHLDYDDSLPSKTGRELISPILTDDEGTWRTLKTIFEDMKLLVKYFKVDDKCANHIHFDASIFNKDPELLFSFMVLLAETEPVLTRFYNGEFVNLRYYALKYAREFSELILKSMPIDKSSYRNLLNSLYGNDNGYKIYAFDFSRLYQNNLNTIKSELNTFENRLPNGTINPIIVQNNVMLTGYLIKYILSGNYDYEKGLSEIKRFDRNKNNIDIDLAFYVADFLPDLYKLDFLKQYYKDGSSTESKKLKKALDFF